MWDETTLQELHAAGVELAAFWTDEELAALFAEPVTGLTDENAVVAPGPTAFARGDSWSPWARTVCSAAMRRRPTMWTASWQGCPRP